MNNQLFVSLCSVVLLATVVSQSDNVTDSSDATNTTTATATSKVPMHPCAAGLMKCMNSLAETPRSKIEVLAYIDCLNSVECDNNEEEKNLKAEKLKAAHTSYQQYATDDDKSKSASSRPFINMILLAFAIMSIARHF